MTAYNLGNWLNIASFYMVAGCGAAISMKSGEFNLGGEGQIYAGGFAADFQSGIVDNSAKNSNDIKCLVIALVLNYLVQAGVGGIDTWGSKPLEEFRIHPTPMTFTISLRPWQKTAS